jgi:outer membrane protein assembly factor BamB
MECLQRATERCDGRRDWSAPKAAKSRCAHRRSVLSVTLRVTCLLAMVCETRAQVLATPGDFEIAPPPEWMFNVGRNVEILESAEAAIARTDWESAFDHLQPALGEPEDTVIPRGGALRSFRGEVIGLLRRLPPAGRDLYERRIGASAAAMLDEARRTGSPALLQQVATEYPCTNAGIDAAFDLARGAQDRGDSLTAALWLTELDDDVVARRRLGTELGLRAAGAWIAAGEPERAAAILETWKTADAVTLSHHGRETEIDLSRPDSLALVTGLFAPQAVGSADGASGVEGSGREWRQHRGGGDRNATAQFAPPSAAPEWVAPPLDVLDTAYSARIERINQMLASVGQQRRAEALAAGAPLLAAANPVVVRNRVIVRGPDKLRAFDLDTGEPLWVSFGSGGIGIDEIFNLLVERQAEPGEREEPTLELFFGQRGWRDLTSSRLAADDERVYAIMGCGMLGAVTQSTPFLANGRHELGPSLHNRLNAIDVDGGILDWSLGGARTNPTDPCAGLFFLGPPLAHRGLLYCLAEDRGDVRLLVLDPRGKSPVLLWSQSLQTLPQGHTSEHNDLLRTAGLTAAADGDVIICPTGGGLVIAVDAARRQLLWFGSYEAPPPPDLIDPRMMAAMAGGGGAPTRPRDALDQLLTEPRWQDATPLIAEGCVVVPAMESDMLVCFRLSNGELLWQRPREAGLYLAGAVDGHVVVVEGNEVRAVRLMDGADAWHQPFAIPQPSGQGFRHGTLYTLPLLAGGVATIDLVHGRIVAQSPLNDDFVAGNLVSAGGRIVSASPEGLAVFPARDAIESRIADGLREEATPEERAVALRLRGELQLHAGDESQGIADLEAALAVQDDVHARRLLVAAHMTRLRDDFATHLDAVDRLDALVVGTPEEREFRRLCARGFTELGDPAAALTQYLRWSELLPANGELERFEEGRLVDPRVWLSARVGDLYFAASPEQRELLEDLLEAQLQGALGRPAAEAERSLEILDLACRGTGVEGAARLELARRSDGESLLTQEARWLPLTGDSFPEQRGEALAKLAELYLLARAVSPLPALLAPLEGDYAETPVVSGRTGRELVAGWRADPGHVAIFSEIDRLSAFHGEPIIVVSEKGPRAQTDNRLLVPGGARGPLAGWQFRATPENLSAINPQGEMPWSTKLGVTRGGLMTAPERLLQTGHLLVAAFDDRLVTVDALTTEGTRGRRRVHEQTLKSKEQSGGDFRVLGGRMDRLGNRLGLAGPLTVERLVYLVGEDLMAVNPRTREPLWKRTVGYRWSQILGDDIAIVLRPVGSGPMLVLDARDGAVLAERMTPRLVVSRPATADWGRLMLTSDQDTARNEWRFAMFDPLTGENVWTFTSVAKSIWTTVSHSDLLIVGSDGRMVVIDALTGEIQMDTRVDVAAEQVWDSFTVLEDSERFYFCMSAPRKPGDDTAELSLATDRPCNGVLTAVDKATGVVAWRIEVDRQFVNLEHPGGWPFLALAALHGRGRTKTLERRIIDKQTGELWHQSSTPIPDGSLGGAPVGWDVDLTEPSVRLMSGPYLMELEFGAAEAVPDEQAEPETAD